MALTAREVRDLSDVVLVERLLPLIRENAVALSQNKCISKDKTREEAMLEDELNKRARRRVIAGITQRDFDLCG